MVLLAHTKERGTKFARPQPKAYMYLQVENMTAADNLIITAIATRLILQNQGYTQSFEDIRGVSSMGQGILSRSLDDFRVQGERRTDAFMGLGASLLVPRIKEAMLRRQQESKEKRREIVLEFSFLRGQMEKGGLLVQAINCPNCGASMKLPESGTSVTCAYCNKTLQVEDVFEKMKRLVQGL